LPRKTALIALGATTALAAAGAPAVTSGSGGHARAAASSVSVTGKEFKFTLSTKSPRHGSVTFRFKNAGSVKHDFKIAGKKTKVIKPGKTTTLTVTLKKGTYKYLCTVPGHAAAGMKGKLTAK
jgi:uncharacterized cupredoxin-like copper-binding protein